MKKVIRDGKVAVIYSPQYGAGWFSWHSIQELLFDPVVVEMIESREFITDEEERYEFNLKIHEYCIDTYGDEFYGGINDLTIAWLPEGEHFIVQEYDGYETVLSKTEIYWITA